MSLIKGIHHVSMKCKNEEEYKKAVSFYTDVLGIGIKRQWDAGMMLDAGGTLIEIFKEGGDVREKGVIRHFAFACDDPDKCADAVRNAGYEVFVQPKDVTITSDPPLDARVAFCIGPLGEDIEFFFEK